ncbi:hypothetical protein B0T24DRAFT_536019 [Lasiosphaeria ovina]|uniref:Zn(2)-C6 fungal-type domain-containing protein n=1 Tax=Lasiosphaeria ovina TaxID=92902 RepID=A0AAE0JY48_9PEZI|nr:hypothetical protein B0T24DRAFT_536019 [Lasiosphaeria ovina]
MTTASPGPEPHGGQIWGGIAENREAGPWIKHEFSDTPDPERILASVPTVEPQDRKYKIVAESSDNPEPIIEKQRARIVKHPKSRVTLEGKNSPAIKKEFSDGPSHDNETLPANKPLDDFRQNLTRNTGGPGDSQLQVGGSLATDTANPSADNSCGGNKRRSYQDELRRDTFDARLQGACVRCHQQRIRCVPNPDDIGLPCSTCLAVKRNSKKTIHDIVCIRFRLRLLDLFRHGGIHVTERFLYTDMKNVDIQTGSHITISMSQGLCKKPMKLRLQEFIPNEGDILYRKYIDNGVWKKHHTQPFWLSDITQTAMEFEVYIKENALDGLLEVSKDSDWIVKETFTMIHRLCSHPVSPPESGNPTSMGDEQSRNAQHAFLLQTVHLWFTMRHGTGSAWIAGEEKLGILPMPETSSTVVLRGKTPIPRMLVAQFDCIRHGHLLKAMAPKFLRIYEALASESSSDSWFTVYLATFLIIHEVSWASSDRLRYARENSDGLLQETRYGPIDSPLTEYVERIQHDGAMFLGHWRYFKRLNAWDADWDNPDKTILEQLRPGQLKFMKATVEYLKKRSKFMGTFPETPSAGCWENELFWVSRLLTPVPPEDDLWTPPVIFDRTRPEVGREH